MLFQSTHPCGVRTIILTDSGDIPVSIHAPVWGANLTSSDLSKSPRFNPRTRVGCELTTPSSTLHSTVSIHAPVWGAKGEHVHLYRPQKFQSTHPCGVRNHCKLYCYILSSFNPRTRVGCEYACDFNNAIYQVSIHAPVWGANRCYNNRLHFLTCFNPRTRVGCESVNSSI